MRLRRSLPNVLTLARVVLATGMFAALALMPGPIAERADADQRLYLVTAAILFILAAATDALDGNLARRWNVVSRFGRVMDPFADKLLILGSFCMLAGPPFTVEVDAGLHQVSGVAPWVAVIVLARELLVTSIRAVAETEGVDFSAVGIGKLKMVAQSFAIPVILLGLAFGDLAPGAAWPVALMVIAWVTAGVTAASGIPYIIRSVRLLRPTEVA